MKKILITFLFSTFFSSTISLGCGGTFYACGNDDVVAHGEDFDENCSEGDQISVIDLCHPAEPTYTFWIDER